MRLNVVNLVTEPLKADQVLHRLPDDAGDRHPGHHAEQRRFSFEDGRSRKFLLDLRLRRTIEDCQRRKLRRERASALGGFAIRRRLDMEIEIGDGLRSIARIRRRRSRLNFFRTLDQVHLLRLCAEQGNDPGRRGQSAHPGPDAESHDDAGRDHCHAGVIAPRRSR